MELPPEHSRLFEYRDARGCGVALTQKTSVCHLLGNGQTVDAIVYMEVCVYLGVQLQTGVQWARAQLILFTSFITTVIQHTQAGMNKCEGRDTWPVWSSK